MFLSEGGQLLLEDGGGPEKIGGGFALEVLNGRVEDDEAADHLIGGWWGGGQ